MILRVRLLKLSQQSRFFKLFLSLLGDQKYWNFLNMHTLHCLTNITFDQHYITNPLLPEYSFPSNFEIKPKIGS